jgi:hypothetical protein
MFGNKPFLFYLFILAIGGTANAQPVQLQQGLFYKSGTALRLGGVQVLNKQSAVMVRSNLYGAFAIPASKGDTLSISYAGYNSAEFIVDDLTDRVLFLKPAIALAGVVIKETSVKADLNEVKQGYRKKSVFYTGTPHYYYLFLKPMTFIYENFKSEVKNARRFNRYAKNELSYYEIAARFNDRTIKKTVPIGDEELEIFESGYWPSLEQVRKWNDYDLSEYIIISYRDFKNNLLREQ